MKHYKIMATPLTSGWFERNNQFVTRTIDNRDYHCISYYDIDYCFNFADFRDDWGFYIEYTDSPDPRDDGTVYMVSCGIKTVEHLKDLIELLIDIKL
jgi:hypothetical protein